MPTPTSDAIRLSDPLSEVTRGERRTLLAVSAIGIIIVKTGLVPTKITALGIDFSDTDRVTLIRAISAVIGYFLVAFMIYGITDFTAWRYAIVSSIRETSRHRRSAEGPEHRGEGRPTGRIPRLIYLLRFQIVSTIRATFEFVIPILIAVYAIGLSLTAPQPPPKAQIRQDKKADTSSANVHHAARTIACAAQRGVNKVPFGFPQNRVVRLLSR